MCWQKTLTIIALILLMIGVLLGRDYLRHTLEKFSLRHADAVPIDLKTNYKGGANYELGNREYLSMLRRLFKLRGADPAPICNSANAVTADPLVPIALLSTEPTSTVAAQVDIDETGTPILVPLSADQLVGLAQPPPPPTPDAIQAATARAVQHIGVILAPSGIQVVDDELIRYKANGRGGSLLLIEMTLYRIGRYHGKKVGVWVDVTILGAVYVRDIWIIGIVFEDKIGLYPVDAHDVAEATQALYEY